MERKRKSEKTFDEIEAILANMERMLGDLESNNARLKEGLNRLEQKLNITEDVFYTAWAKTIRQAAS